MKNLHLRDKKDSKVKSHCTLNQDLKFAVTFKYKHKFILD